MGYTAAQQFVIPFLVLRKALNDQLKEPTEFNKRITSLVLETCAKLMRYSDEFEVRLFKTLIEFASEAGKRTIDIVPSINILVT
jgi:hypothetical protein